MKAATCFALATLGSATEGIGSCRSIPATKHDREVFDAKKLLGTWYEQLSTRSYQQSMFKADYDCSAWMLMGTSDGGVRVIHQRSNHIKTEVNPDKFDFGSSSDPEVAVFNMQFNTENPLATARFNPNFQSPESWSQLSESLSVPVSLDAFSLYDFNIIYTDYFSQLIV